MSIEIKFCIILQYGYKIKKDRATQKACRGSEKNGGIFYVLFCRNLRIVCTSESEDVDKKSAYIIGTGLAGLTAAFYLVRDGQMKGEHIHLLEKLELAGGSCDGRKDVTKGFFMRGGREMDNHFEVMWDTFRDVPSIETPGVSVLDEYYWLNKHDPNYSLCRATVRCGEDAHTDKKI